ncbi:hypothetical protein ACLOJK_021672 [Asimina triloba]
MPEHTTAENILNSIVETLSDSAPKKKSVSFFNEENTVSAQMNRLFGRQNSIHNVLGGGKSADVLLWRNKKISSGVLVGATAIWVLFEWLNYNFMALTCFALVIGMLVQFVWTNASGLLNSVKQLTIENFLQVLASLWAAAIVGSWFNFLTVLYVGSYKCFVAAHTLPVLYERYEDQVDDFVYNLLGQFQNQYQKLDRGVLSKIPKGNLRRKKFE